MQCHSVCTTLKKGDKMIADRIKRIREQNNLTQSELAKHLGITRSSVNAWELGISIPSTQYIVELSRFFRVSTDYLLNIDCTSTIDVSGLTEKDIQILYELIEHLRSLNKTKTSKQNDYI